MNILIFVICFIIILGVLIKYFKCYWLIAGYNTASAEKKKNTDIVGLSRFVGNICFVIAGFLVLDYVLEVYLEYSDFSSYAMPVIIIILAVYAVIRAQKFKLSPEKNKINHLLRIIFIVFVIALPVGFIIYGISFQKVTVNSEYIKISGVHGIKQEIKDITDIELKNSIPKITRRTNGLSLFNIRKGNFKLKDIGKGKLYIYKGNPPYIYISTGNDYIIINYKDAKETEELYKKIKLNWEK